MSPIRAIVLVGDDKPGKTGIVFLGSGLSLAHSKVRAIPPATQPVPSPNGGNPLSEALKQASKSATSEAAMFDRFDILSAYYVYGTDYHTGQFSKEYAYIGRALNAGFKPSNSFSYGSLSENGKEIYNRLVANRPKRVMGVAMPSHRPTAHTSGW